MTVGLVIVSHSAKIADGVCELAAQMAPDVPLLPAGGMDAGPGNGSEPLIGTSFDKVQDAVGKADQGSGVVILTDLGSAVMTAESVLEFVDDDVRARVRIARAALVEGAVAAAVQAQTGAGVDDVVRAAEAAGLSVGLVPADPVQIDSPPAETREAPPAEQGGRVTQAANGHAVEGSWELPNPLGLHARPAAVLARAMTELDAEVTVNGVDAKSVMLLMSLGLGQGKLLTASATGPDATTAIEAIGREVANGFGEL